MEEQKVIGLIAALLNMDAQKLHPDTSLREDCNADSLDMFQILLAVEQEFRVDFDAEDEKRIKTIQDLMRFAKQNAH